jgi:hypothetical protein
MRMKRWESPRREGRNDKGKKRSARQRQIKKQTQVWRQKLSGDGLGANNPGTGRPDDRREGNQNPKKERPGVAPFCLAA